MTQTVSNFIKNGTSYTSDSLIHHNEMLQSQETHDTNRYSM